MSREGKKAQNYEANPPRCRNCYYFSAAQPRSPEEHTPDGKLLRPALQFIPPTCLFPVKERDGVSFAVNPNGVCDEWMHAVTKEKLEKTT